MLRLELSQSEIDHFIYGTRDMQDIIFVKRYVDNVSVASNKDDLLFKKLLCCCIDMSDLSTIV